MKFRVVKHLLFAAVCLFFSRIVPAQPLPQLPADSRIQRGTLGCGAAYYMVVNPSEKGYAHVAVVQKDTLTAEKRHGLDAAFLGRMGILPGKEGFLSQRENHTRYRFPRVPVFRTHVLDSTLLYTFAQMALSDRPQAIIVSGDIDPAELKKKMDIFSMLVPRLKQEPEGEEYLWMPSGEALVYFYPGKRSSLGVSYASARIPANQMNTAQALVTDMFGRELETVLRHRLERNFREEDVPYSRIRFVRKGSDATAGDEQYGVEVLTAPGRLQDANRVLARTLSEFESYGVSALEFSQAKDALEPSILQKAGQDPDNGADIDRCMAHFLYGAHLAPFGEEARLFTRKNVADQVEASLFKSFSSALLQGLTNLTLTCTAPPDSLDQTDALFQYNLGYLYGWVAPYLNDYTWHQEDTLGLNPPVSRVRVKSEKPEPVTGGTLWTFSNGIRVAYKQVKGGERFHYALQLNGGLSRIPDLKEGEGGYIGDMLGLYNAGGLEAADFRSMLASNGISLKADADLHNLYVKGSAPSDKLVLVLKTLLVLANRRTQNPEEVQYFVRNGKLRSQSLADRMDGLIAPHFQYSSGRLPEALSEETARKAERLFEERFSQVDDGMLILAGDMEPGAVKKILLQYLGAFRTSGSGSSSRKQVHFRTLSGVTTYSEEGYDRGLYLLLDADCPLTALNYLSSFVVAEAVRSALATHLAGAGLSADVQTSFLPHPQERLRMLISCSPTGEETDLMPALTAIRAALQEVASKPVSAKDLAAWKQLTENNLKRELPRSETVVSTLLTRYALGKDLTSRYSENIKAITADRVGEMLRALAAGGRIEFIAP